MVQALVRHYDRGATHRLVLENNTALPGANEIIVRLLPNDTGFSALLSGNASGTAPPRVRPSPEWVDAQADALFPADFTAGPVRTDRNIYGDYTFTRLSNGSAATCLLGWQRLKSGVSEVELPRGLAEVFVRLRFCDAGSDPSDLQRLFRRLRLDLLAWNRRPASTYEDDNSGAPLLLPESGLLQFNEDSAPKQRD